MLVAAFCPGYYYGVTLDWNLHRRLPNTYTRKRDLGSVSGGGLLSSLKTLKTLWKLSEVRLHQLPPVVNTLFLGPGCVVVSILESGHQALCVGMINYSEFMPNPELSIWKVKLVMRLVGYLLVVLGTPLYVIRTRLSAQLLLPEDQYKYTGCLNCLITICKEEGIAPFTRCIGGVLLSFMATDIIHNLLNLVCSYLRKLMGVPQPNDATNSQSQSLTAREKTKRLVYACIEYFLEGANTGLTPVLFDRALQTVALQGSGWEESLQLVKHTSAWECMKAIYAEQGLLGYCKGLVPAARSMMYPVICHNIVCIAVFYAYNAWCERS